MSTNRKSCFVIMPFSKTSDEHTEEYWTEHFESFLKPLIEECSELEAHRSEALRGDIVRQIITQLVVSPVVVADLTDGNSNVYWELGVRQGFKHGTITIAEEGTELPFDLSAKGTLFYYPGKYIKTAKFTRKFKKAINDCLSNPDSPDSHVLETISGRGTLFQIIHRDEAIRRVEAMISETAHNSGVVDDIYKCIKANKTARKKKKKGTRRFPVAHFRSASIELLVTTRYLEAEKSFYEWCEEYLTWLSAAKLQVSKWTRREEETEKWFIKVKKGLLTRLDEVRKNLSTVHQELIASC